MRKLSPYIFKYWRLMLGAMLLLVVMTQADLSLPDYLSRIVNIGIQQNGIDQGVPEVISAKSMQGMAMFMPAEDHARLQAAYTPLQPGSPEAQALAQRFLKLNETPAYQLAPAAPEELQALETLMGKPLLIVSGIQMMQSDPQIAQRMLGPEAQAQLAQLPPGSDLLARLAEMPAAARDTVLQRALDNLGNLDGMILHQLVVRAVGDEYTNLGMDMQASQTNFILRTGLIMLGLALVAAVCSISVSLLASRVAAGVARNLRLALFTKVETFSSAEFNQFSTASLITRTTNDITQLQQMMFMVVRMAFMAPLIAVGGIIRAVGKSPNMWWLIALAVLCIVAVIAVIFKLTVPKFKLMQTLIDRLNQVTRENLSGLLVVRAFNKQRFEEKRFDGVNQELTGTQRFVGRTMVGLFPVVNVIMTTLNAAIIWVGAREVANSTLQIGNMMAFQQYSMQIMFAFINLSFLFIMIPRAAISGDRIAEVLETPLTIKDPAEPKALPQPVQGKIEFKDVCFKYPGAEENVLDNINFTAKPGEVTAIIGSTGSGKSTLVNLVPRFFDVTCGEVLLDGIDIRELRQSELRDKIGYMPQRALLFSGTVETNMQVGKPDASPQEMEKAIKIAQATDFVFNNNNGLETEISQGGSNVSGGQKQRLSIARALVKNAPIYIFDDTFSALDYKTDAALRRALEEEHGHATVLMVTQRVATARSADQILVLDDGQLVGKGKHEELMQDCKTYSEIANSQLSKQELA